jgi:serine/threonine protein kinase
MADNPRVRDILDRAAELAPERRPGFLDSACAGDAPLRAEVESLLRALDSAEQFMARPTIPGTAASDSFQNKIGSNIGPYRLLEKIGDGGMGVVFLAEQDPPVRRQVALKVIKPGMDSAAVIERFEAERQTLALMDHTGIARVYDAGTTSDGRPYFVMELVRGIPVTTYCDENRVPPRERLELVIAICLAVRHAHEKGIIHRDLKPGNVLVTVQDDRPMIKVIDFGVAKAIDQVAAGRTVFTQQGVIVGTPEYMSPEQAGAGSAPADTRTDIYSLGVILYELLTGQTPLDRARLRQVGYEQMMMVIREAQPQKPSTRMSIPTEAAMGASSRRATDRKQLAKLLAGDLDLIVMKCLEKDMHRRYDGVDRLARDLRRFLDGESVEATAPSLLRSTLTVARRQKMLVAVTAATLVITAVLVAGFAMLDSRLARRQAADQRADHPAAAPPTTQSAGQSGDQSAPETPARVEARKHAAAIASAKQAQSEGDFVAANKFLASVPRHFRDREWKAIAAVTQNQLAIVELHQTPTRAEYNADGSSIVVAGGGVHFYDPASGEESDIIRSVTRSITGPLAASKDGALMLVQQPDKTLMVEHTGDGKLLPLDFKEQVCYAMFSPDGKRVATTAWDYTLRIWDTSTGAQLLQIRDDRAFVITMNFSPDGTKLVTDSIEGVSRVWETSGGKLLATYRNHNTYNTYGASVLSAFSADGRRVVSSFGENDHPGAIWDAETGKQLVLLGSEEYTDSNYGAAFSPDGKSVAIGGQGDVTLFSADTGKVIRVLHGHSGPVQALVFNVDGSRLLSSSIDGTARVWNVSNTPATAETAVAKPLAEQN